MKGRQNEKGNRQKKSGKRAKKEAKRHKSKIKNRGIFMKKENAEFIYVFKNTKINKAKWLRIN